MRVAKRANRCKVIAITNHKGGVGKTTTAINLAAGLAKRNKKVIVIDSDPQANFSICVGEKEPENLENTLADLYGEIIRKKFDDVDKYIRHSEEGFDYIASNLDLESMGMYLIREIFRESKLKQLVSILRERYSYIIIDCCPAVGILTQNAIVAADSILIPLQAQYLSVRGLESTISLVSYIQEELNPKLKFEGILLTLADARTNDFKYIYNAIHEMYGTDIKVFETVIPESVRASEAAGEGVSIFKHDPKGKVAKAYKMFVGEVLKR